MRKNRKNRNKGQSTLEYLIVFAVIIATILLVTKTIIKPAVEDSMNHLGNAIRDAADKF